MFSDLSCDTLPFDIPSFGTQPHEDPLAPLGFDDLLDIAREFEFTRTITHIWPCEEPSPCSETELDDIFAAIMPTPSAEECPLPLPSSALPISLEHVHLEEVDVQRSVSVHPVPDEKASISTASVALPNDDDQIRSEVGCPITSILRGWSPPNGSQFLDIDDTLMIPQSATDAWLSPWLTPFLSPSNTQSAKTINQAPTKVQEIDDSSPTTESKSQPTSIIDMAVDNPRRDTVPFVVPPAPHANPEPGQDRPSRPTNPRQSITTPHTKITKYRAHSSSAPETGDPPAAKYAKAPRGGIPPHIARTVTKAHFLRMEKERKVMQDAFSSTNPGEGKKPSVLRKAIGAENMGGECRRKNPFDLQGDNEKKGRTKRVKV